MKLSSIYITTIKIIALIACLLICFNISAQRKLTLNFNESRTFKIAQFTDLHWVDESPNCEKTTSVIKYVLEAEKPDCAILTGDIAWRVTSRQPWHDIPKIFEDAKIPFAVVLGNHDAEGNTEITRDEIFDILSQSPFFIGEKGPDNIDGIGNYVLPVYGHKNNVTTLLYCFDSHSYAQKPFYGSYEWIHLNQILWYRELSQKYTQQNKNKPIFSLAFLHIPLPEYDEIIRNKMIMGNNGESVVSPQVNSGLFSSFVEMQDVKGVFAGHDHDNDFIGLKFDIALAYGRMSGFDAYGSLSKGARIIKIYEDAPKYDTWICTPEKNEFYFYYPSGLTSEDEKNMFYFPAKNVKPKRKGVRYIYYEGNKMKSFEDTITAKKTDKGIQFGLSIKNAPAKDAFAYDFHSLIYISQKGVYRFYTHSDDGSKLFIDGNLIVDNDNSSGYYSYGKVALNEGFHDLRILYFDDCYGEFLEVGFCNKNMLEQTIPDSLLYIPE